MRVYVCVCANITMNTYNCVWVYVLHAVMTIKLVKWSHRLRFRQNQFRVKWKQFIIRNLTLTPKYFSLYHSSAVNRRAGFYCICSYLQRQIKLISKVIPSKFFSAQSTDLTFYYNEIVAGCEKGTHWQKYTVTYHIPMCRRHRRQMWYKWTVV